MPELDLIRQVVRELEQLQHELNRTHTPSPAGRGHHPRDRTVQERRRDRATASTVAEALRMKTAFNAEAAGRFLKRAGVAIEVRSRALAGRRDPRQVPDRRCGVPS